MLTWCDIGVNIFSSQFDTDRQAVIKRAANAGVRQLILIGSDIAESQLNISFCQQNTGCYTTAGVHPHQAANVKSGWLDDLTLMLTKPNVIAVGECGLDFNRDFSPRPVQQQVFAEQLQLAVCTNKPVYLHERDAFDTQLAMLKEQPKITGVAHCFTGDSVQLKAWLDLGLYIGITGWLCDERRGDVLRHALQYIPLDRLLLETDAPYLLPRNLTPKPASRCNEPAFLVHIANTVATLRQLELSDIARITVANSKELFKLNNSLLAVEA
ncbi:TatD family hydrolase [Rheinheimera baltica]|uniref:TatD family hydrolase n=1 Tax=Rheinheimera baltica TaxID=67576 RepID=A0ABT9I0B0_9GAMM|nr:TatD family hydrolase [Rheinheimera baltica]MDP5136799.1 TatD family hydrolase [Rheinheimera baltica]MDP5142239.1 TatD family hydrolase [Rheinheimera baltica]